MSEQNAVTEFGGKLIHRDNRTLDQGMFTTEVWVNKNGSVLVRQYSEYPEYEQLIMLSTDVIHKLSQTLSDSE